MTSTSTLCICVCVSILMLFIEDLLLTVKQGNASDHEPTKCSRKFDRSSIRNAVISRCAVSISQIR